MTDSVAARSWMLPDAKRQTLMYVSTWIHNGDFVLVYSYPKGLLMGTLIGFFGPMNLCSDKTGDIFVPNYFGNDVLEYAHAGTHPIATFYEAYSEPVSCSVDPTTGDLAVGDYTDARGYGALAIYRLGSGSSPQLYETGLLISCAYDLAGNLFADAELAQGENQLVELPHGKKALITVTLPPEIAHSSGLRIAWDGAYLAVNQGNTVVYRLRIANGNAQVAGSTSVPDVSLLSQLLFEPATSDKSSAQGVTMIAPDWNNDTVRFWHYPAGGKAFKTVPFIFEANGVAVSR